MYTAGLYVFVVNKSINKYNIYKVTCEITIFFFFFKKKKKKKKKKN